MNKYHEVKDTTDGFFSFLEIYILMFIIIISTVGLIISTIVGVIRLFS
jgi:hypothetical protein